MKLLAVNIPEPNTIDLVDRMRYPLITFVDRESQIPIDITCDYEIMLLSSNVTKQYIYPNISRFA